MAKKFSELRAKMSPERRARIEAMVRAMLDTIRVATRPIRRRANRRSVADPVGDARAVFARPGELLFAIRRVRVALEAAENLPAEHLPDRRVHLTALESFERSMLAALEDVVAELKVVRGDTDAESWVRRRLNELR